MIRLFHRASDAPILDSGICETTTTGDARSAAAKALAIRASEHGVDARLELFPVDAHAFQLFWSFLPEAADAIDIAGSYIHEKQSASVRSGPQRASASSRAR